MYRQLDSRAYASCVAFDTLHYVCLASIVLDIYLIKIQFLSCSLLETISIAIALFEWEMIKVEGHFINPFLFHPRLSLNFVHRPPLSLTLSFNMPTQSTWKLAKYIIIKKISQLLARRKKIKVTRRAAAAMNTQSFTNSMPNNNEYIFFCIHFFGWRKIPQSSWKRRAVQRFSPSFSEKSWKIFISNPSKGKIWIKVI